MTIIAAYEGFHHYWIGSDSLGVSCGLGADFGTKLIKKGNYIIAFSSSYRVGDVARESKNLPKEINSIIDVRKFRDALSKDLIEEAGARTEAHNGNGLKEAPVGIIIVSPTGMYAIEGDFQVHKIKTGYYANGSGWAIAYGALYIAKQNKASGEEAISGAIKAAIAHSTTCGGRCHVKSIEKG